MTDDHRSSPAPSFDPATLGFYASEAPVYVASGPGGTSRHLAAFLDRLPAGGRILELGCGGGRDSEAMLARGFVLDATDGVPEMAREAKERLGQTVRVMRFDELDAIDAYDAVWAHASLLHVPRPALASTLGRIHAALKPGGFHFANFKGGGAEGRDRFGRYFNYLTVDEMTDAYRRSADWQVVDTQAYEDGGGYSGGTGPWVAITVRK